MKKKKIKLIHCTKVENLKSIQAHNLMCYLPYLPHHSTFIKEHLNKKDGKIIYATPHLKKGFNLKSIQDYIFFQCWGKPRNIFAEKWKGKWNKRFWNSIDKISLDLSEYAILTFEVEDNEDVYHAIHVQNTIGPVRAIPEKFQHTDKPLCLLQKAVNKADIKLIGHARPLVQNNSIQNIKIDLM